METGIEENEGTKEEWMNENLMKAKEKDKSI